MKDVIRRWILTGLSCPAAARVLCRLLGDGVFCVMLHRIGEKDPTRLPPNEDMKVSPAFLERFIVDARRKGFTFLSVSQLHAALTGEGPWPSRSLVLALDDGYRDNLTEGLPLFERHGVPFTIYLSTAFIGSSCVPWWYGLEGLLSSRPAVLWGGRTWDIRSGPEKSRLFMQIRGQALLADQGSEAYVSELYKDNDYDCRSAEGLFLTWDEVRALRSHPLAELGNHGHRHLNLQMVSREAVCREFSLAKEEIARQTGCVPVHYAYAYGLFSDEALSVVREIGALTCMTTAPGRVSRDDGEKLWALPRFMLYEGMSVDDLLARSAYVSLRRGLRG